MYYHLGGKSTRVIKKETLVDLSRYIYLYYSDSNHTTNSELWRLSNYPLFFFPAYFFSSGEVYLVFRSIIKIPSLTS